MYMYLQLRTSIQVVEIPSFSFTPEGVSVYVANKIIKGEVTDRGFAILNARFQSVYPDWARIRSDGSPQRDACPKTLRWGS